VFAGSWREWSGAQASDVVLFINDPISKEVCADSARTDGKMLAGVLHIKHASSRLSDVCTPALRVWHHIVETEGGVIA
jgi:hypothetical protein